MSPPDSSASDKRPGIDQYKIAFLKGLGAQENTDKNKDPYQRVLAWEFPDVVSTAMAALGVSPNPDLARRVMDTAMRARVNVKELEATQGIAESEKLGRDVRNQYDPDRAAQARPTFRLPVMRQLLADVIASLKEKSDKAKIEVGQTLADVEARTKQLAEESQSSSPIRLTSHTPIPLPKKPITTSYRQSGFSIKPDTRTQAKSAVAPPPRQTAMSPESILALDDAWLQAQPEEKRPRLLLRAFRERAGISQRELSERMGVYPNLIFYWEKGIYPIKASKLGLLAPALGLCADEAEKFIFLVRPSIVHGVGTSWLREKLAQENWEHISYPALDEIWLQAQPEASRFGLLLRDYRERLNLTGVQLGEKMGVSHDSISEWETGRKSMDVAKLGKLCSSLGGPAEEMERLILLRRPQIVNGVGLPWLRETIERKQWEDISYPALNEIWLQAQPEWSRAGLRLHDLRRRRDYSREQLARELGINANTLAAWEAGENPIREDKLDSRDSILGLSKEEMEDFLRLVRALNAALLHSQMQADGARREVLFHELLSRYQETPPHRRGGLALEAYMVRQGVSVRELAQKLEITESRVSQLKTGSGGTTIGIDRARQIAVALSLSLEEARDFLREVELSIQARRKFWSMEQINSTQTGASIPARKCPELMPHNPRTPSR